MLIGAGVNTRFNMLIISLLWSLVGLWAAISLGMYRFFLLRCSVTACILGSQCERRNSR